MRVFAPHVSAALVALFAAGVAPSMVRAADPPANPTPRVVFDDMDNPVSPANARRSQPVPDSVRFDANDNPITAKVAVKAAPAAAKSAASSMRRTAMPQAAVPASTISVAPTPAPSAAPTILTPAVFTAPTPCDTTVRASPNPLKAWATTLTRDGDRLYLGLHDGGIAWCDTDGGRGMVVRLTLPTLPVRALAASNNFVWWVSGDGATVFSYRAANRAVTAYPVTANASGANANVASTRGWVQRIALLDGVVLLSGERATRVLDPATGSLRLPTVYDGLPVDALQAGGAESLYIVGGEVATVATVGGYNPSAPRVWRSTAARRGERDWREVNVAGVSDEASLVGLPRRSAAARFDLEDAGFALAQPGGLRLLLSDLTRSDRADASARIVDVPFGHQPGMPTVLDRFCVGASGAWWLMHGTLFHAAPDDGQSARQEAYLPWNSAKGAQVQALLPDTDGVYVALDRGGVRHIMPDKPSAEDGYGGYIRARLGDETTQPTGDVETTIAAGIEEWQGVPYLWGGQSMTGTDCSGFVGAMHKSVGISIPRSTAEMKASRDGGRIRDEIRYGDVLVYPGHCALYTGDGHTAETVSAGVGKASIWRRTDVVVKRYLP